jgi:transposase
MAGRNVDRGHAARLRQRVDPVHDLSAIALTLRVRRNPAPHDRDKYRLRSRIEQLFNKLKNWRRIATRYDKTRTSYLGFVSLASALLWLPFVHEA